MYYFEDQFHAACLADSIFASAMVPEVSPFPMPTGETMLIEETHG
jgi:hypothetical protein